MARVQQESFKTISEKSVEWKREMDHFPGISPVNVKFDWVTVQFRRTFTRYLEQPDA